MDLLIEFFSLCLTFISPILIILILYIIKINYPKRKGRYLEDLIALKIKELNNGKILRNLYIPRKDSTITHSEIDLLFIHSTGFYVIEAKNYNGWIFGDNNYRYWTVTYNSKTKHRMYNPIWQNSQHIKILKDMLNLEYNLFHSIIVFNDTTTIKIISSNKYAKVLYMSDFLNYMKEQTYISKPMLSEKEIQYYYDLLKVYSNRSKKIQVQHINEIGNSIPPK